MSVIKIIELVGQSAIGWEDAVKSAVEDAAQTIRHLSGVKVLNWTANIDEGGKISEYKANVQLAFRVEPENGI